MKKELSPAAMTALIALAVIVVGGGGWLLVNKMSTSSGPSPDLLQKQIEYQKSLIPGGKGGAAPPNAGLQSEMEARARTKH